MAPRSPAQPHVGARTLALLEQLDSRRSNLLRVLSYRRVEHAEPFERQMEHIARRHPVVSVAQVLDTFEGGHPLPSRAVLLTFRELEGFGESAWPILRRYGFAAVLFVPEGVVCARRQPEPSLAELQELARQGVALGFAADEPELPERVDSRVRAGILALERVLPDLPRLLAYPDGRPSAGLSAAASRAGVELGFTTLAGVNDLYATDRLHLRSIAIDGAAPLEVLRARLMPGSRYWRRLSGAQEPSTHAERRCARELRSQRARLRYVHRPLDAVLTASLRPRPSFLSALRNLARRRSSNYERLRNLVLLGTIPWPALERRVQRALLATTRLPMPVSALELIGYGSAATVFRVTTSSARRHVLKVYRWTIGLPPARLVQIARRHRARYRQLRQWFGESVLPTHYLVMSGPLRGLPVVACLQELVEGSSDLLARTDAELLGLLRSRAELSKEFVSFTRRLLELRARGFFPDLLGRGNLLLVEREGAACLRLIDYGLFDLRCGTRHLPVAALRAAQQRLEALHCELDR